MISTMRLYILSMLLGTALITTSALADPMVELAVNSGCFICHAIDADKSSSTPLAPSYRNIAVRYKNRSDAFNYLAQRLQRGTVYGEQNWSGTIGMRFMPPNHNITKDQAATLVNWILALDTTGEAAAPILQHERMMTVATTSGCLACHRINPSQDSRLMPLAPALVDIANRLMANRMPLSNSLTRCLREPEPVKRNGIMPICNSCLRMSHSTQLKLKSW